eukprot:g79004.t1
MRRPSEISSYVFTGAPAGQHGWLITFREQNSFQTSRIQRPDRKIGTFLNLLAQIILASKTCKVFPYIGAVKMSDEKKSPLDQVAKVTVDKYVQLQL